MKSSKKLKITINENDESKNLNNETFINRWFPNIDDKNKEDIQKRIKLKGWYIYEKICKYIKKHKYTPTPELMQSIFIYDKRIRFILFKYIGMIEEHYRSKLYNYLDYDECSKIEKNYSYKDLINELEKCKICNENEIKHLESIRELRNNICHHYLLTIDDNGNKNIEVLNKIKVIQSLLFDDEIKTEFKNDLLEIETKELNKQKYSNNFDITIPEELKVSNYCK